MDRRKRKRGRREKKGKHIKEKRRDEKERRTWAALLDSLSEGSALNGRSLQSFPVLARTGPGRGEKGKSSR